MSGDEYLELEVTIIKTTDGAALIDCDGEQSWVPWSCVEDNGEDFAETYEGPMYVKTWFCRQEGLC